MRTEYQQRLKKLRNAAIRVPAMSLSILGAGWNDVRVHIHCRLSFYLSP